MEKNKAAKEWMNKCRKALNEHDRRELIHLYDNNNVDWDNVSESVAKQYDKLVDEINDYLYTDTSPLY